MTENFTTDLLSFVILQYEHNKSKNFVIQEGEKHYRPMTLIQEGEEHHYRLTYLAGSGALQPFLPPLKNRDRHPADETQT